MESQLDDSISTRREIGAFVLQQSQMPPLERIRYQSLQVEFYSKERQHQISGFERGEQVRKYRDGNQRSGYQICYLAYFRSEKKKSQVKEEYRWRLVESRSFVEGQEGLRNHLALLSQWRCSESSPDGHYYVKVYVNSKNQETKYLKCELLVVKCYVQDGEKACLWIECQYPTCR